MLFTCLDKFLMEGFDLGTHVSNWPSGMSGTLGLELAPLPTAVMRTPLSSSVLAGEVDSQNDLDSLVGFNLDSSLICFTSKHLEHTQTRVTPGDQVNNFLSLAQRVQVNRRILQHLLSSQRMHLDSSISDTGFVPNDLESEVHLRNNHSVSESLSPRQQQQQQREDRARMKRRCFPVRGDHNLLTPDTHTALGVRLRPVTQVRLEGIASHSGHLNDLYSSESAAGSTTRRLVVSPGRRLRFEDETEMEAESRYQERQRRQVGTQGTGVLVSKPDLNIYINGRAGVGPQVVGQCHTCGKGSGDRADFSQHLPVGDDRGQNLYQTHLNLRTEPIRETYIGSVTPGETRVGRGMGVSNMQVRRRTNQVELNGNQITYATDLPVNPYAPDQLATLPSRCLSASPPPMTSSVTSLTVRLNGTKAGQDLNQDQELGTPAAAQPHSVLRAGTELTERSPCVDLRRKNSASSYLPAQVAPTMMSQISSDSPADSQAPPTSESSSDGQVKQPIRTELHSDDTPLPEQFCSGDESSHLSLRRLFSNIRLSRTRTGSLDQLRLNPHPPVSNPSPPGNGKTSSLLKKSPSVQSLSMGVPFSKLRKSSSVQSFGSEQKKKDRSVDYRPGAERFLPRTLSIEDVGHPGSSRSVGRVLQVCSDGTFQLELSRPPRGTFGFIISRGRGSPDSGVYVEDMLDCSTEKLYSGLLSVGDEILEVNGEKVAGLSLDQVTLLLTQNPSVMVWVLRHRRPPPW